MNEQYGTTYVCKRQARRTDLVVCSPINQETCKHSNEIKINPIKLNPSDFLTLGKPFSISVMTRVWGYPNNLSGYYYVTCNMFVEYQFF